MPLNGAHPCYRAYRCADGWMSVAALEPKFWARLCELLGVPDLTGEAFAEGADAEAVARRLEAVFAGGTREHWREHLRGQDVCCEPVLDIAEVVEDPQVRHRADEVDGTSAWFPFRVGAHGHAPGGAVPAYGGDSRDLLAELGVDSNAFDELVAARVTA
jgi:crotonobetainyl-CoA:carnitine CoA-transferase CaiB-like acyl-CoA transferase